MPQGRKGYGEELKIRQYLSEITPAMFSFVKSVLNKKKTKDKIENAKIQNDKIQVVCKILPKIIDKVLPNEIVGDFNMNQDTSVLKKELAEEIAKLLTEKQ